MVLPSGDAEVEVTLDLDAGAVGELAVPSADRSPRGLKVSFPEGASGTCATRDGISEFALDFSGVKEPPRKVRYSYTVAGLLDWGKAKPKNFGNISMGRRIVNTTRTPIKYYEMKILLPGGYALSSVRDSVPELEDNETVPPYEAAGEPGFSGVKIHAENMNTGESCSILFLFKADGRSWWLFGLLCGVAGLYLFFFRDLVAREKKENT